MTRKHILQIVPRAPGTLDGLSDYAFNLAKALHAGHGLTSVFAVARGSSIAASDGFPIISGLGPAAVTAAEDCDHVVLHYVNYGYQDRGLPFELRRFARELRPRLRGRWVTTFHEIYASGPPWKSEFWLRPFQVRIAHDLIDLSDVCFASNVTVERAIHEYAPAKKVCIAPVMSNFGEPAQIDFEAASPNHWSICGGTASIARSLSSFEGAYRAVPHDFSPQSLTVIGGRDDKTVRAQIEKLRGAIPSLTCEHHPEVTGEEASALLSQCSFAWLDYFGLGKMWPGMILKSGVFAACCAHGVVPVLSHREDALGLDGDPMPGPWFITPTAVRLPAAEQLVEARKGLIAWYRAHAHSSRLARLYAEALS